MLRVQSYNFLFNIASGISKKNFIFLTTGHFFLTIGLYKTNRQVVLVGSLVSSSTDSKVDGRASLYGFFEAFVEAVIGRLRGGNDSGKEVLAYYDFLLFERKSSVAVAETTHLPPSLFKGEGGKTI